MPKLYNAPAYARPGRAVVVDRPFDPDDLPLEANRSSSDRAFVREISGVSAEPDGRAEERSFLRRALLPFNRRERSAGETSR
jgi:hypothetical protein